MKKSSNLKHRLMVLMLSVVLAATTLITFTSFSSKNVEASVDNEQIFKNYTMAAMIAGTTEENYNTTTVAYYTALKYYSQGTTEVGADEFCKTMSDNFSDNKTYTKDMLKNVPSAGPCEYDSSKDKVMINAGMGDSLQSYYVGEKNAADGTSTIYGAWKDWADDDAAVFFVALKVKDGKIVSYSPIDWNFVWDNDYGFGFNMLPNDKATLKVGLCLDDDYRSDAITYRWNSKALNINEASGDKDSTYGSQYTIDASKIAKEVINEELTVDAYIYDKNNQQYFKVGTGIATINIKDCNLALSYRKADSTTYKPEKGTTLQVGEGYWFSLEGADWGWDFGNGEGAKKHTFYNLEFKLNGKTIVATEQEKNLSNSEMNLSIGAGGGVPNRIITPKKPGKLTIKGTIYRNGKVLKTVSKTYTVAPVKKTTLKSVKNVKGKKMTIKWSKNTAGTGYQIQYSTNKKFSKGNKTKSISQNKTTSYTLSKLTKKKTYYVRIRTVKKVSKKTYYSSWSSAKKVKINK